MPTAPRPSGPRRTFIVCTWASSLWSGESPDMWQLAHRGLDNTVETVTNACAAASLFCARTDGAFASTAAASAPIAINGIDFTIVLLSSARTHDEPHDECGDTFRSGTDYRRAHRRCPRRWDAESLSATPPSS